MSSNSYQFESLADLLLMEIFQNCPAKNVFPLFDIPNAHIYAILRLTNKLSIKFTTSDPQIIGNSYTFSPYMHKMTLACEANIDFNQYSNLRCLELLRPTREQLEGLDSVNLPYLEHLIVGYMDGCQCHSNDMTGECRYCEKVFSNGFPNLISCRLYHPGTIDTLFNITQSNRLKSLKVELISLISYQMILSACPNLEFFQFSFPCIGDNPSILVPHFNLRRMVINFDGNNSPSNDYDIDGYLSRAPNLEQLSVYRENEDADITLYLNYDWLANSIDRHLPSLRRFIYHFCIDLVEGLSESDSEHILNRLKEHFQRVHNSRYQSKLVLKLDQCSIVH